MLSRIVDEPIRSNDELLTRVAWYYYHDGLTQNMIGEKLDLPRIKVSRLLEAGRRSGLIQVRINSGLQSCLEIERRLEDNFGLTEARVIPALESAPISERLGQAAAQYLMQKLPAQGLLAVGWGAMVSEAIQRLGHLANEKEIDLVSMTGGVHTYVDGIRQFGGASKIFLVPAPLIVGDGTVAKLLMREVSVHNTLEMSLGADFALVGIGAANENATVVRAGCIHPSELQTMRRQGAVGDVLCRFMNSDGDVLAIPLHDRVIGLTLDELGRSARVVAAAAGLDKIIAIRAALNVGFIKVLITDETTALALLKPI